MLLNVLKQIIEKKQTEGLAEKLDIFYAVGKLTAEQYEELTGLLEG